MDTKHFTNNQWTELEPFLDIQDTPKGLVKPPTNKVVQIATQAPMPYLAIGNPANGFRLLKNAVIQGAGFDFLAKCADVMRPRGYKSNKVGVASRSNHKAARAFDYDQSSRYIIVVSEPQGTQQFFRTWLKCANQDGSQGIKVTLKDIRGYIVTGYYFDFTACALKFNWVRIPAWKGWSVRGSGYTKMEFWHYQMMEGLSWDEAMTFLYGDVDNIKDSRKPANTRILGLNDRGAAVRNLQEKLSKLVNPKTKLPYLPRHEVDGVYGIHTQLAVKLFQENNGLDSDGLYGPNTRNILELLSKGIK